MALTLDAWDTAPRRVVVDGRRVRVGWFRHMDAHTIGVTRALQDRVALLVVPPPGNHGRGGERDSDGSRRGPPAPPADTLAAAGINGEEPAPRPPRPLP